MDQYQSVGQKAAVRGEIKGHPFNGEISNSTQQLEALLKLFTELLNTVDAKLDSLLGPASTPTQKELDRSIPPTFLLSTLRSAIENHGAQIERLRGLVERFNNV